MCVCVCVCVSPAGPKLANLGSLFGPPLFGPLMLHIPTQPLDVVVTSASAAQGPRRRPRRRSDAHRAAGRRDHTDRRLLPFHTAVVRRAKAGQDYPDDVRGRPQHQEAQERLQR